MWHACTRCCAGLRLRGVTYSEETAKQGPENFLDALSNSRPAVRLYSDCRATPTAWQKRAHSPGGNNAETEGRNQKLRAACCARYGVPSAGTGCHDTLSEHGPDRAVSDGPNGRDRTGSQCCTQFDLRWRRSHAAGTGGIRDRGEGHEWFSLHRGEVLGAERG